MTIDQAFYDYIAANVVTDETFVYGSAEGQTAPYIIMTKVADPERPITLCLSQGESGSALFQFSCYAGGTAAGYDGAATLDYLNDFKDSIADILGLIGANPNDYRIQSNMTTGVTLLGEGANNLVTWGAMFECNIEWEKV